MRLRVTTPDGRIVSDRVQGLDFENSDSPDPAMLGDALYRLVLAEVVRVGTGAPAS